MRLTLRTLLAYIDDTLDAPTARDIGQKVEESDYAQDLIERIRRVIRTRRLSAPRPLSETVARPGLAYRPTTLSCSPLNRSRGALG